jgi:hypothetical protein
MVRSSRRPITTAAVAISGGGAITPGVFVVAGMDAY